jgi:hypothetical protein
VEGDTIFFTSCVLYITLACRIYSISPTHSLGHPLTRYIASQSHLNRAWEALRVRVRAVLVPEGPVSHKIGSSLSTTDHDFHNQLMIFGFVISDLPMEILRLVSVYTKGI